MVIIRHTLSSSIQHSAGLRVDISPVQGRGVVVSSQAWEDLCTHRHWPLPSPGAPALSALPQPGGSGGGLEGDFALLRDPHGPAREARALPGQWLSYIT